MLHLFILPFYDLKQVLVLLVSCQGQSNGLCYSRTQLQKFKGTRTVTFFLPSQTLKSNVDVETHVQPVLFLRARVEVIFIITLSDQVSKGYVDVLGLHNLFSEISFSHCTWAQTVHMSIQVCTLKMTRFLHYVPLKLQSSLGEILEKEEVTIIKLDVNKIQRITVKAALQRRVPRSPTSDEKWWQLRCRAFDLLGSYAESIRLTSLPPPLPTKVTETMNCFHLVHIIILGNLSCGSLVFALLRHFGDFSGEPMVKTLPSSAWECWFDP